MMTLNAGILVFPPYGGYRIELCRLGPNPAWKGEAGVGGTCGPGPVSCPPPLLCCLEPCLTCFGHAVHQLSGSPWPGPSRGATPWDSARHRGLLPASRPEAQAGRPLGRQVHLNHREGTLITCLAHRYVFMSCKPATPRTAPAARRPRMRSESPWSGLGCLPHGHCSVSKRG